MKQNQTIEDLMDRFKPLINTDYIKYRNHIYRVFLNCLLLDDNKNNEEKYAVAAVFHDIGIWTDHTIDYLNPSIEQAKIYLSKSRKQNLIKEITLMIYWHHKINKYQGEFAAIVENFRKADWIDVSIGLFGFGLDRKVIKENRKIFPNKGFHWFLIKKIMGNLFRHPLKPLPMFKQ
ncbi:MAG TPA: hypothetical protein VJU78_01775 [Chitinophagaceae bacterium]|nr:hypothetical protein [Chitinophagaceae bacterium]